MKVLIIKLSSIGDVVHTLPALHALRKGFDKSGVKAEIDWLVEEAASGILEDNPLIDKVITVRRGWGRNLGNNIKTARLLAKERYDIVMDFQGLFKSGVWVLLSKGKRRIGFSNAREGSHIFLNEKLPPYDPERHAVDRYLDLARYAGGVAENVVFPINIPRGAEKSVAEKLERCGAIAPGSPFFVMVARARWATKLWDDEKFAEFARRMTERTGFFAVLTGGQKDREALESMRSKIGARAVNLAGMTGLQELSALLKRSRFVLTVDSGPMHIAAACGSKVAALFGPTAPWRTGPYGSGHRIISKGVECSPCFRKSCADARCMGGITVEDAAAAVDELLKEKRQNGLK